MIGADVGRLGPLLTPDTLAGLGLETQQALARLSDGVLRALAGTDAATLDALAKMMGESPALRARLVALAESNPAQFGELLRTQKAAALDADASVLSAFRTQLPSNTISDGLVLMDPSSVPQTPILENVGSKIANDINAALSQVPSLLVAGTFPISDAKSMLILQIQPVIQ